MAENKTKPTALSVNKFLESITDEQKRADSYTIIDIMQHATKEKPVMWGSSIVGFGKVQYKYPSGHSGEICLCGFSPRKQSFSIYITYNIKKYSELLKKLGKHKTGVGCLYINKLSDIDIKIFEELIKKAIKDPGLPS